MAIMTHAKFHFNWLMLTSIFGIWASEPPLGPGERLKKPGLIGLKAQKNTILWLICYWLELGMSGFSGWESYIRGLIFAELGRSKPY